MDCAASSDDATVPAIDEPGSQSVDTERYARHLLLPGVGPAGQRRLRAARVLVVGAGGLGAPVLQYLAAAGVGHVTVVDDDEVETSNLQRQVIHRTQDVGLAKVDSAQRAVGDLNPDVEFEAVRERLTAQNVVALCSSHDVVIDATDNFATRFVLNDACVLLGLPLVWAAVHQFNGQLTVWSPGDGPCLRCLFAEAPDASAVPSCAEAGVLGVLPGLLGAAQASEAIKLIVGVGTPMIGRLAIFDALAFEWSQIPIAADPLCAVCGADAPVVSADLAGPAAEPVPTGPTVSVEDVARLWSAGQIRLLDVRTGAERDVAEVAGAEWLTLDDLRAGAVPDAGDPRPMVTMCKSGARSLEAARLLAERGIDARSMEGGILAWSRRIDPQVPRY